MKRKRSAPPPLVPAAPPPDSEIPDWVFEAVSSAVYHCQVTEELAARGWEGEDLPEERKWYRQPEGARAPYRRLAWDVLARQFTPTQLWERHRAWLEPIVPGDEEVIRARLDRLAGYARSVGHGLWAAYSDSLGRGVRVFEINSERRGKLGLVG